MKAAKDLTRFMFYQQMIIVVSLMHKLHTSINDLWHLITLSQNVCTFVYILVELHCV